MTDAATSGSFNCPNCGAPLEPENGVRKMNCTYCNTSVVIPKEMRTRPQQTPVVVPTLPISGKGCSRLAIAVAVVGLLVVVGLVIGITALVKNMTKDIPGLSSITSGFAAKGLTFGSKGIGQGMFTDARSVAVDSSNGNILVGDYQDGRVQTFNSSGKYLSTFTVGSSSSVDALLVGTDGKVYVAHHGIVHVYDSIGKELSTVNGTDGVDAMAFGADGSLYILTGEDVVKRFDASGNLTLTISNAFSSVTGTGESTQYIAVDGIGNIYIIGEYSCTVLKYSSTGQYLDKFGGKAESTGPAVPGTVFTASGIGVDGYGRVFVSDWNTDLQVFDTNGTFIQSIDALTLGFDTLIYGMNMDSKNTIYLALGDKIMELKIKQP